MPVRLMVRTGIGVRVGGILMTDVANSRYDIAAKNAMTGGASAPSSSSTRPTSTSPSTSTTASSPTATSGSCAGVAAWSSSIAVSILPV